MYLLHVASSYKEKRNAKDKIESCHIIQTAQQPQKKALVAANTNVHTSQSSGREAENVFFGVDILDFEEALTEVFTLMKFGDLQLRRDQKAALNVVA